MNYPAHIRRDDAGREIVQTVAAHNRQCAVYARAAAPPGLEQTAYLAGLLHDMGKYTEAFKQYIERKARGEEARRGSVNHTFAGARYALERWHTDAGQTFRNATSELLAFAIGAHHGQFDCISPDGADGFRHRLTTEGTGYEQARANFLQLCENEQTLDRLFDEAVKEVQAALDRLQPLGGNDPEERLFHLALLARHTLSAVIEGDRRDTAEFMRTADPAAYPEVPSACWADRLAALESRLAAFPNTESIDQVRKSISDRCRMAAGRGSGVFRLNVPTGGGKTLASLRYALAAAAEGKKRIFFVIPLLSVLEQNAKVIRDLLGDDRLILEHHSNVVQEKSEEKLDYNELLLENWQAPMVITTLVQLLNTLLAGQSSCIRRMNALRDSVIVIDEVQSVPRRLLSEFNLALNYLASYCGASVVLCSATQPCLEKTAHRLRYAAEPELVPQEQSWQTVFRRTEIIDRSVPDFTVEELAGFACEQAGKHGSLLLICNTRTQARALYAALQGRWKGLRFHLSNAMCMAHRMQTMTAIQKALDDHAPVICISTQLVEAGVDFSFGCVIRVLAGLDNIVQSAGRCNRSGDHGRLYPVYIVRLRGENLSHLKEIRECQQAAASVLLQYSRTPTAFANDLAGEAAVQSYYRALYAEMKQGAQDYPLPGGQTLLDYLSVNQTGRGHCAVKNDYLFGQAFATAGQAFHVFDDNTTDVLTPFAGGAELIDSLGSPQASYDLPYRQALFQQTGRFSVSLYQYELDRLRESGGVYALCDGAVLALLPEFYSDQTGFSPDGDQNTFMEV